MSTFDYTKQKLIYHMERGSIKFAIVTFTVAINVFLIYLLLLMPYNWLLTERDRTPHSLDSLTEWMTIALMGLIIVSSVFMIIKYYKTQKILVVVPVLTFLVICSLFVVAFR